MSRSWLLVPGCRPEQFDAARAAGADRLVLDLEDGVAPADKAAAREAVAAWLDEARPVVLRINGPDTEWFDDDLDLCGHPAVQAVLLPHAERVTTLRHVSSTAPHALLLPMIESARGFAQRDALAEMAGVERLVFGSARFQRDLGLEDDGEALLMFRSALVLASRLAGRAGPVAGLNPALRADCERVRRLGFAGTLCRSAEEVAIANAVFTPACGRAG